MSYKTKMTFYCDAVDCKVNQTLVIGADGKVETGRGDRQPVWFFLTRNLGWGSSAKRGSSQRPESILTFCPQHRR